MYLMNKEQNAQECDATKAQFLFLVRLKKLLINNY